MPTNQQPPGAQRQRSAPALMRALTVLILLTSGCQTKPPTSPEKTKTTTPDLRITEEPFRSQKEMNEAMEIAIQYLKKETGLKIEYVPAINYAHSHQMIRDGDVDAIIVGIYGGYKLMHNNPSVKPLVIEEKVFRNGLIANKSLLKNHKKAGAQYTPLSILHGKKIAFGGRSSGSTFLQPLLTLHNQRFPLQAIKSCIHEPNTTHLPAHVADGIVDLAFIGYRNINEAIPEALRDTVQLVWESDTKRNDFIAAIQHPITSPKHGHLQRLKAALLNLNPTNPDHKQVLDAWLITGFDPPDEHFPEGLTHKIASLHEQEGGIPTCEEY